MNNNFRNVLGDVPPVTLNIIIINFVIWLIQITIPGFGRILTEHLALHYVGSSLFNPVQIFTYAFMHDPHSVWHILFNMFTLWMFGRILERVWGAQRFFIFYFICAIGAAFVQEAVWAMTWFHDFTEATARINGLTVDHMAQIINSKIANHSPDIETGIAQFQSSMVTIGASGAVYGLLLGFAFVFPNMPLYLFFIPIPIKAKWMVIGYGVIEFFLGIAGGGTIAHFAHLGGMLFGLLLLLWWRKKGTLRGNGFY